MEVDQCRNHLLGIGSGSIRSNLPIVLVDHLQCFREVLHEEPDIPVVVTMIVELYDVGVLQPAQYFQLGFDAFGDFRFIKHDNLLPCNETACERIKHFVDF